MKKHYLFKWIAFLTIAIVSISCEQESGIEPIGNLGPKADIVVPGPDQPPTCADQIKPDLTISSSIIVDRSVSTQHFLAFGITMTNCGHASANISNIIGSNKQVSWTAYLSDDGFHLTLPGGISTGYFISGTLPVGGTMTSMASFTTNLPLSSPCFKYLVIMIHSDSGVGECNLSNNKIVVSTPII